jgi:hypothetical protein
VKHTALGNSVVNLKKKYKHALLAMTSGNGGKTKLSNWAYKE